MIGDLLGVPGSFGAFALALLIFGVLPGPVLALIVRMIPDLDRRRELQAELYEVPRWERPFWVAQQFEVAIRIGLMPEVEWFWGRHIWHRSKLESGVDLHRGHPETFWIPSDDVKDELRAGDLVKLMWSVQRFPGERMWVRIVHREGKKLTGTLENWPIYVYLHPGEVVRFDIDDIIDYTLEDGEEDQQIAA